MAHAAYISTESGGANKTCHQLYKTTSLATTFINCLFATKILHLRYSLPGDFILFCFNHFQSKIWSCYGPLFK